MSPHSRFARWLLKAWPKLGKLGKTPYSAIISTLLVGIAPFAIFAVNLKVPLVADWANLAINSPLLSVVLLLLWLIGSAFWVLATLAEHWQRASAIPSEEQLLGLMDGFDLILGQKMQHYDRTLAEISKSAGKKKTAKWILGEMIQAETQYEHILSACWGHFMDSLKDAAEDPLEIQVILAEMGPKHIKRYVRHYPPDKNPRSVVTELQHPDATFSRAKELRELVVVDPIRAEQDKPAGERMFHFAHPAGSDSDALGMIMCDPVLDAGNGVPLVLSVHANQEGISGNDAAVRQKWESILKMFALRIGIEYRAQLLQNASK